MRAERLSCPYAECSSVTAYTVHSRMKKPTARISTKYSPMVHAAMHAQPRQPAALRGLNPDRAPWQDDQPTGIVQHGLEARDRQQELFVVVDAAVAGAAPPQHCFRGNFYLPLY